MLEPFPVDLLRPTEGVLSGADGVFALTIPLEPFELDDEEVETEIIVEGIEADAESLAALAGRTLTLSSNPEPGYADGSVYLVHAHVPFDVTRIAFGDFTNDVVEVKVSGRLLPECEGMEYEDADVVLQAQLRVAP